MALIKCGECGAEISDKAAACVKCGAPVRSYANGFVPSGVPLKAPKKRSGCLMIFVWFFGFVVVATIIGGMFGGSAGNRRKDHLTSKVPPPPYGEYQGKPCGIDDLVCRGEAGSAGASVYCKSPVERLAKHTMRWTDGTLEPKFSRYRFTNARHETITYIGDKAEFQNGFGAYTPVIYQCTMANDGQTVLGVSASEGRLPQ